MLINVYATNLKKELVKTTKCKKRKKVGD